MRYASRLNTRRAVWWFIGFMSGIGAAMLAGLVALAAVVWGA